MAPQIRKKEAQRLEAKTRRQHFVASLTEADKVTLAKDLCASFCAAFPLTPEMRLAAYWPLPSEADTRPLLEKAYGKGASISLPCAHQNAPLTFHRWHPQDTLVTGPFGVREPDSSTLQVTELTHILIPLLAFDLSGQRLGYGQGHYDRTLSSLRSCRSGGFQKPLLIGFAFAAQEVDSVFTDPHDQVLDAIVTEKGE